MRSKFPGYYTPTKEEFDRLWKEATFVFDTNVLLDFYRYSDETVQVLLKTVEEFKGRVWIPYRVSFEYHRRMNDVIGDQVKAYEETKTALNRFKQLLEAKRGHPFLSADLHTEVSTFCEKLDKALCDKAIDVEKLFTHNPTKNRLAELLDGQVGDGLSKEEMDHLVADGVGRYDKKVPPGYKDKGKGDIEQYGDLILWREMLKQAKEAKSSMILVTRDAKEDWFLEHSSKSLGPRPELVHEFREVTGQMFYIYQTDQFIERVKEHAKTEIPKAVSEEVLILNKWLEEIFNDKRDGVNDGVVLPHQSSSQASSPTQGEVAPPTVNPVPPGATESSGSTT